MISASAWKAFELLAQPNELVTASQGNFSYKNYKGGFDITLTGLPWQQNIGRNMTSVERHDSLKWVPGRAASSEWRLHAHLYDTLPIGAIVHTHPVFATVLSDSDVELRVGEYPNDKIVRKTVKRFSSGSFQSLEYEPPFDEDQKSFDILLRGHGLLVASKSTDVTRLIYHSAEIERLAKVAYLKALLER